MMPKKPSALAGIFDDEPAALEPAAPEPARPEPMSVATPAARIAPARRTRREVAPAREGASRNHGTKKPVLIHIPEDMHRMLRRVSVEEGEPLTAITERMLRQYLVAKGHTKFAP